MKFIDLHTHTNHSDAEIEPAHSLAVAEELGLSLFSFSDHNTVSAYSDLSDIRNLFSGGILPAVELSTTFKGDVIEVLGYGIDTEKRRSYDIFRKTQSTCSRGGDRVGNTICAH